MNATTLLALMCELYEQAVKLRRRVEELEGELAECKGGD